MDIFELWNGVPPHYRWPSRHAPEGWRSSAFFLCHSIVTYRDMLLTRSLEKARIAASKCNTYFLTATKPSG